MKTIPLAKVIALSLLLFSFSYSGLSLAQTKTVFLLLQEKLDTQGRQLAIEPGLQEIIRYFELHTGLKLEPKLMPWNRAQYLAINGDGIIFGLSKSPERLNKFDYSEPLTKENVWAISYGEKAKPYRTPEDLKSKLVSIGRGFSHGMAFEEARQNKLFQVQEDSASESARFRKLSSGRSDIMLWPVRHLKNSNEVTHYIRNELIPSFHDNQLDTAKFHVSIQPIFYDTLHFAAAKGKFASELKLLNKAIISGKKQGQLEKLMANFN